MKCTYCDNEVPNGASKCPSCGGDVTTVSTSESSNAQQTVQAPNAQDMMNQQMMTQQMMTQQMMNNQAMNNQMMQKQMEDLKTSTKSKLVYMLLGICIPGTGFSNFYIGRTGVGIIQLILTCTMIGFFISAPWNFIEAFVIDKDGQGKALK